MFSELQVTFSKDFGYRDYRVIPCSQFITEGTAQQPCKELSLTTIIREVHGRSVVWRGAIEGRKVVAKISYDGKSFEKEARFYRNFQNGDIAPKYFGLYNTEDKTVQLMLLEDCGELASKRDFTNNEDLKFEIMQKWTQLHKLGISHGDLGTANTLVSTDGQNSIRIIDFETAKANHKCKVKECPPLGKQFDPKLLPCTELYGAESDLVVYPRPARQPYTAFEEPAS